VTGTYTTSYTPSQAGRHAIRWVATGANAKATTDVFNVRDSSLLPVVSLQELKTHLRMTSATTDDEKLRQVLDAATAAAEGFTSRALTGQTVTESLDGGGRSVRLSQPVALSITSVTESGNPLVAADYQLRFGAIIERVWGYALGGWTPGVSNIAVVYVAGVSGRDFDAAQAGVLEIAKHMWETQRGSQSMGAKADDQWIPGMGFSIPNRAAQLLEPLRVLGNA